MPWIFLLGGGAQPEHHFVENTTLLKGILELQFRVDCQQVLIGSGRNTWRHRDFETP
jgi:hypothetical protein